MKGVVRRLLIIKKLLVKVDEQVEHLMGKRMSKNGAIEVINTLIHSVVTYALQFASFSKNAIRQIDASIMRLVKSKLKIARSTDDSIVKGSVLGAGLGIQTAWDKINIAKLKILSAGLNSKHSFYFRAMLQRVTKWHGGTEDFWQYSCPNNFSGWIRSLWTWMNDHEVGLQLDDPLEKEQAKRENDFNVVDLSRGDEKMSTWLRAKKAHWFSELQANKSVRHEYVRCEILSKMASYKADEHGKQLGRWYAGSVRTGDRVMNQGMDRTGIVTSARMGTAKVKWDGLAARASSRHAVGAESRINITSIEQPAHAALGTATSGLVKVEESATAGRKHRYIDKVFTIAPARALTPAPAAPAADASAIIGGGSLQNMIRLCENKGDLVGGSDGSLNKGLCSYGWTIGTGSGGTYSEITRGGNGLAASNYKNSSTRAEGMGLLCGLIASYTTRQDIVWYCDSEAAIKRYKKLKHMSPEEWEEVESADVWRAVRHYQKLAYEEGVGLDLLWVKAHVDDKKKDYYLSPQDRRTEHKINILCDAIADEHLENESVMQLPGRPKCAITFQGKPAGKPPKAILLDVQWEVIKKLMHKKPHIWGDVEELDLDEVRVLFKSSKYNTIVRQMKLRWGLIATHHTMMIQRRVLPEENRCPLCSTIPDTLNHLVCGCEFPAMQRIRQQWSTKIKDTLIKSAVNKTTAEALAAVWTNTTNSKSPDDKLVEAFVEMVQDAGGCAPLNIPVSAHFKGFLEVVEADKPKKVIKKLWEISSTAVNEMWLARNELGKVVRKDTSQYNKLIKEVFDEGLMAHLDITCDEVMRYKAKGKEGFLKRFNKLELPSDTIDLTAPRGIVLGTEVKRYFHGSDTPDNGVVLTKDLTTETGTVEYASRQEVWEEPLHEIYGNEVANTSTPTRLEANVLNEVFKNANQRTCAVVKIQPTQDVCKYTVVQYNGDKTTRTLPELRPLLRPNAVPQEGHKLELSRDEPMPTIAAHVMRKLARQSPSKRKAIWRRKPQTKRKVKPGVTNRNEAGKHHRQSGGGPLIQRELNQPPNDAEDRVFNSMD